MKKVMLALTIILMLTACAPKSTPEPTKTKAAGQEWAVTKSTYIYDSPSFDSGTKGELAVGDIITLPAGVINPECETISEPGLSNVPMLISLWILQKLLVTCKVPQLGNFYRSTKVKRDLLRHLSQKNRLKHGSALLHQRRKVRSPQRLLTRM